MFTSEVMKGRRSAGTFFAGLLLPAALCGPAIGQESKFSGPQAGESLSPFTVLQVVNPEVVAEVEIMQPESDGATVLMFMHKLSEPAIGLMISIEWYAAKQKDVASHYIILTEDVSKSTELAKRWSRRPFFSRSPMSISVDGLEGPGRYGLNRNLDMTVIIAKKNQVAHNFAINGPNNSDAPKILEAIAKTIGQPAPSYEKVRAELQAERKRRREARLRENSVFKLAPNAELGRMMVAMIYREQITEEDVQEVTAKMKKWADDDEDKQKSLAEYAKKVLDGDFKLNRYAREALKKLSGK